MGNTLAFLKGQGGLGRPLSGSDYIGGLLFYSASLPSGFGASDRVKVVYSPAEAVALGIVNTSIDETKSKAKVTCAGTPAAGNTIKITYAGITGTVTVLDTYTLTTADAVSTTTAATAIAAAINAGTTVHGFTATSSTADVIITTKAGEGVFPNSGTPYVTTLTGGGLTGAVTQPTGSASTVLGVASDIDIMDYHVSEYFRMQPKGKLYIGVYATADVGTFANVGDLVTAATGEIRLVGIYQKSTAYSNAHLTTIQAIADTQSAAKRPFSFVYTGDIQGTFLTALTSVRALNCPNGSTSIAQDGAAKGYKIYKATNKSIGAVGTCIGTLAFGKVNEDIAWIEKFPVSDGVEFNTLAFSNGDAWLTTSDGLKTNLDNYGYLFLVKEVSQSSSYWNDSHCAIPITSDYAYIEMTRTIDKAIRNLRAIITPALAMPLKVERSTGKLRDSVIGYFESLGQQALDSMLNDDEISDYQIVINPNQNVISTSKLTIAVELIPTGSARSITVNIGYVLQLSNQAA